MNPGVFIDRRSGALRTDPVYAEGFLDWCYNTRSGIALTRGVLSRWFVSALYGWYYRRRWTRRKIAPIATAMGINLDEVTQPLESFRSFSDFFSRRVDLGRRPIDPDTGRLVSPADGRMLTFPALESDEPMRIKGSIFDMERLLDDRAVAARYCGGAVVIVRLYLADYHHFHFPDSGIPREPRPVAGRYYAVTPYARKWAVPFYGENHRVITLFDSDHFGKIAIVEIGAFTVGSIRQCFAPGVRVAKGEHKGFFELGGSTVVLLFEPSAVRFDEDLCRNSSSGVETFVLMGGGIGWSLHSSSMPR